MKYVWRILKFSGSLWRYYAAISVFTILLSAMGLLQPLLSGWAIDEMRRGTEARVGYVILLAVIIFSQDLLSTIFSNIGGYIGDQMSAKLNQFLSRRYYEHLLQLPQQFYDTELSGKIINRLNRSVLQIANFMQMMSNNFLQFIFTTVFSLVIVAIYSWPVALMLLSLYPIYVLMTFRSSNTWQEYQSEKNTEYDIASGRFAEAISQVKVVKSFVQEARELKYFQKHVQRAVDITKPQSMYWHKKDVQRRVVLNVIFLAVYLYIFVQGAHGNYTPGEVVTLVLYAMQIRIPIFTISFLVDNTQKAIADSKDYFELMEVEPAIDDHAEAKALKVSRGEIVYDNVTFGYDNTEVLKNLQFAIKPDTKIALVGESGEGKTTITSLLLRLYEPNKGVITIDGQDIREVTQHSLRQSIGVVFQDPALFSGTIRENIAYANPKATSAQVEAAARAANAHEFVEKLEKGYDTEIGERGLKLSGGQKQRIAIARALLKDAPILLLDEATSSLDSRSEALVQEALERLMKGRTTIIIAHRLSTIQHVDQIITLKGGKVDEVGTPASLARSGGIYAQLLQLQRGAGVSDKKKLKAYEIAT